MRGSGGEATTMRVAAPCADRVHFSHLAVRASLRPSFFPVQDTLLAGRKRGLAALVLTGASAPSVRFMRAACACAPRLSISRRAWATHLMYPLRALLFAERPPGPPGYVLARLRQFL